MTEQAPNISPVAGIVFVVIWVGMITAWILMLIAIWRGMKAHERLADKVGQIAEKLQAK